MIITEDELQELRTQLCSAQKKIKELEALLTGKV